MFVSSESTKSALLGFIHEAQDGKVMKRENVSANGILEVWYFPNPTELTFDLTWAELAYKLTVQKFISSIVNSVTFHGNCGYWVSCSIFLTQDETLRTVTITHQAFLSHEITLWIE